MADISNHDPLPGGRGTRRPLTHGHDRQIPNSALTSAEILGSAPAAPSSPPSPTRTTPTGFGDSWGERLNEARKRWEETGELPEDLGDLRALLFLEHPRARFVYI